MAKLSKLNQLLDNGIGTYQTQVSYRSGYIINAFEKNKNFDALIVPMNCFNGCGVGILKAVAERYPTAKSKLDQTSVGNQRKLGTIIVDEVIEGKKIIFVFCSIGYNKSNMPKALWEKPGVNLKSLRIGMKKALSECSNPCMPTFGLGMFPTPWATIEGVLDDTIEDFQKQDLEKTITVFKR